MKEIFNMEGVAMKKKGFNWVPGLFIIGYHLILVGILPFYFLHHTPSWKLISGSFVLFYLAGLGITVGYHRLYSHTTYKINAVVEWVVLFFGTMAIQGSVIRWSFDHRHHHAFVDTDADPYSIKKGFWYAHVLWLFEKQKEVDPKVVSDLWRRPLLRFQHRYYGLLMVLTNALAFVAIGAFCQDYLGAFVFALLVRMFFGHHFTWFINSLAHTWGARTFCKELSAVDNCIIALLTFGEGYHNYHHTFAYDYRNGIRWFHFDPTKWIIWTLSKCGLTKQLRRVENHQIEEKILLESKKILLQKVPPSFQLKREEWEQKVTSFCENGLAKLNQVKKLRQAYQELKKTGHKDHRLHDLKLELKSLKKSLKEDLRKWIYFHDKKWGVTDARSSHLS